MQTTSPKEIVLTLLVIVFGILAINPFDIVMSISVHMTLFIVLFTVVVLFVGLITGETVRDEREHKHRNLAGRVSYVLGLLTILVGIVVQVFMHAPVDVWLVIALMVMIVSKVVMRMYSRRFQ